MLPLCTWVSSEHVSSRVLSDGARYRLYARVAEEIVGDIEVEQGLVGKEHTSDSLSPRSPQQVAG